MNGNWNGKLDKQSNSKSKQQIASTEMLLPKLQDNTILLWQIPLTSWQDKQLTLMQQGLSQKEQKRLSSLSHSLSIRNFVITRTLMRQILTQYLQCAQDDIVYHYNQYGKPELVESSSNPHNLCFNLSHSGDIALFALCKNAALGVDIECDNKTRDVMRLAKRFFHVEEYQTLVKLPPAQQRDAFFRTWTRKEAFAKAIGSGLQFPFSQFQVSSGEEASLIWVDPTRYVGPASLASVEIKPPYFASVAILSQKRDIVFIQWPKTK